MEYEKDDKTPFPKKVVGGMPMYECIQHGLYFATVELSLLHYNIDHERKTKSTSKYSVELSK